MEGRKCRAKGAFDTKITLHDDLIPKCYRLLKDADSRWYFDMRN
jgi:hypothetical protein